MPKICDPPPFTGGQCRVRYRIVVNVRTYDAVTNGFLGTRRHDTTTFGPLDNLKIFERGDGFGGRIRNGVRLGWFDVPTYGYTTPNFFAGIFDFFSGVRVEYEIISIIRQDGLPDNCGSLPPTNCRCTPDSCRVDCATAPNGFCCIDHAFTDRLLNTIRSAPPSQIV